MKKKKKAQLKKLSKGTGIEYEVLKKGYWDVGVEISTGDYVYVIQTIDEVNENELTPHFKNDTDAGEQALKNGVKLFTSEHEELMGWYILDNQENRSTVKKLEESE